MKMEFVFQYQHPGKRPDDFTLTDVPTLLEDGATLPEVGDFVTIPIASNKRETHLPEAGIPVTFVVRARNFWYGSTENGTITGCTAYLFVNLPDNPKAMGTDIKM